jgi:hypothetical protein
MIADGRVGCKEVKGTRTPPIGPRRGLRAKVGQPFHLRGVVAPGGTAGETTAKQEDWQ